MRPCLPSLCVILWWTISPFLLPTSAAGQVTMSLLPDPVQTIVDSTFVVQVELAGPPGQQVDAGEVHLDFDPALMEVLSLSPTPQLPIILVDGFDNTTGEIDFAAGTFFNYPTLPITLIEIEFRALQPTLSTPLTFVFEIPARNTAVTFGGSIVLAQTEPNWVVIDPGPDYCNGIAPAEQPFGAAICPGESYPFFGNQLTEGGTYRDTLRDGFGCDSVIRVLDLTLLASDTTRRQEETTDSTLVGVDTTFFTNQAGCDSLLIVETRVAGTMHRESSEVISLRVYPNPSPGIVRLICDHPIRGVQVYDAQGRMLLTEIGRGHSLTLALPKREQVWLRVSLANGRQCTRLVQLR